MSLSVVRRYSGPVKESLKVCIVGSGPAGFYTAHQLLKRHPDTRVDIIEKLPVPFGLARFGVAPDHPEVKNCINQFTSLARSEKCRFYGNVCVGKDVTVSTLQRLYHAVVLAYGAEGDKELGIPGEDQKGVVSARAFVGWYNGLPSCSDLCPDLSGERAVVFGQGNVALDVARILLAPIDLLKKTDICEHALEQLRESNIKRVDIIGRRGPLQVAFTIKELREMIRLPNCQSLLDQCDFRTVRDQVPGLPRPRRRLTELMVKTADETVLSPEPGVKQWSLRFLRSPVELLSSGGGGVSAVRMEINELMGDLENAKAIPTGEFEDLECSLVLRSIGYKALPLDDGENYDLNRGYLRNHQGRISNGLYCSGWVKTGPVGVIVTTMNNAFETAESILEDYHAGLHRIEDNCQLMDKLNGVCVVSFSDWEAIDREEVRLGEMAGKPREKITSLRTMLELAHSH